VCAPNGLAGTQDRGRDACSWPVVVVVVVVVGGVVPLLVASHYGALGIPRSDDWSYLVSLFRWVDHGRLGFNHWAATPLIGQLVLAAPVALIFGRSVEAVHVLSAAVGVVGLLAVVLAGRVVVSPRAALLVALTIAVSPLWMPLAPTFMTDHWAWAAEMLALACALWSFRRTPFSVGWLVASVALGFFAVTIRQYALVGVAAVLVAAFVDARVRLDRRRVRIVLVLGVLFVVATAVLLVWWSQRPGVENLAPRRPELPQLNATIKTSLGYLRLLGLLLVPVVVLAGPVRIVRSAWMASRAGSLVLGGGVGAALVLDYVRAPEIPFVGNYVARSGVLGHDVLRGPRPDVVPALIFDAMVWIGTASLVLILLRAVPTLVRAPDRVRARSWPDATTLVLGANIAGFAIVTVGTVLVHLRGFDRYLLPVLPVVALAVLRRRMGEEPPPLTAQRLVGPLVAVALLGLVGLAFSAESASFDATRWEVARLATRAGYTPRQVDGGFEWVAWHREEGPPYGPKLDPAERARQLRAFEAPFCVRVAMVGDRLPRALVARATSHAPSRPTLTIVAYPLPGKCPDRE